MIGGVLHEVLEEPLPKHDTEILYTQVLSYVVQVSVCTARQSAGGAVAGTMFRRNGSSKLVSAAYGNSYKHTRAHKHTYVITYINTCKYIYIYTHTYNSIRVYLCTAGDTDTYIYILAHMDT